jgi:hypothetical protein
VLGGGIDKTFYNYYINTDEWLTVAQTESSQRWGSSIVTGRNDAELWANCGAGNSSPFKRDSYVNRYVLSSNTWFPKYRMLPGWTGPRETAYCRAGSALAYEPAGPSEGNLYLLSVGVRRPNFWTHHLTDDDDGGQAHSTAPLAPQLEVFSDAAGYRVRFAVLKPGPAIARIFDATGRLTRSLDLPDLVAGSWTLTWDRADATGHLVPRGAYFLTVSYASTCAHVKLVVR